MKIDPTAPIIGPNGRAIVEPQQGEDGQIGYVALTIGSLSYAALMRQTEDKMPLSEQFKRGALAAKLASGADEVDLGRDDVSLLLRCIASLSPGPAVIWGVYTMLAPDELARISGED